MNNISLNLLNVCNTDENYLIPVLRERKYSFFKDGSIQLKVVVNNLKGVSHEF